MTRDLSGKTALITGASRGIGREIALVLAESGVNCVLVARNERELTSLKNSLLNKGNGVQAHVFRCDATQEEEVKAVYAALKNQHIDVDILINNIGVGKYGALSEFTIEDYDWIMNTNMRSTFLFTHYFLPDFFARKDGELVFIGSVAGLKGLPGEAVYCAAKNAQRAFAHSIDEECRTHNVRVHVMAPGGVHTHFAMGTGREPGMPILDKMLKAEDVAHSVHFALTQPKHLRYFVVGMRPLSETL